MELIENLLQLLVTFVGALLSGISYRKSRRQAYFLLLCFYGCFALGAPTATPEPPLVITVPNVPANGSIMLVYEAEVTAYAPLGTNGSITNTANVTDGNLEVSASETVSTDDRAVLTISKALCPAVVTGNGQITYTFVIENTGNTEASEAERIVLTDRKLVLLICRK